MSTQIQWTDETWNPVTGCAKVSPGCAHCYAEGVANRFWATQYPAVEFCAEQPPRPRQFTDVWTHEDRLTQPLRWRKPRRVFVNSMSDLFHDDVPDVFIERVFSVMALAERHTFQVLTKRPERMLAWFRARRFDVKGYAILQSETGECVYAHPWPLPNVWLGVSVENQHFADERIPLLIQTPSAVRFLSCEPLIARVDLTNFLWTIPGARLNGLRWIIVGGESGRSARPFNLEWARWLVAQGRSADVPVFVKQLGAKPQVFAGGEDVVYASMVDYVEDRVHLGQPATLSLRDSHGGDPSEWPEDLRVREFPA